MMIDKISGVSQINNLQGPSKTSAPKNVKSNSDEISISDEAKRLSEEFYLNQVADETPDVRVDLVEQIKLKIQDPNYLSEATISATADKILAAYGF